MSDTEGQDEPQQGGDFAPSAGRAGKVEGDQAAFMLMEEILERLKLLNYERNFFPKGFSPLTRTFFALPSSNPAEQVRRETWRETARSERSGTQLCAPAMVLC